MTHVCISMLVLNNYTDDDMIFILARLEVHCIFPPLFTYLFTYLPSNDDINFNPCLIIEWRTVTITSPYRDCCARSRYQGQLLLFVITYPCPWYHSGMSFLIYPSYIFDLKSSVCNGVVYWTINCICVSVFHWQIGSVYPMYCLMKLLCYLFSSVTKHQCSVPVPLWISVTWYV